MNECRGNETEGLLTIWLTMDEFVTKPSKERQVRQFGQQKLREFYLIYLKNKL